MMTRCSWIPVALLLWAAPALAGDVLVWEPKSAKVVDVFNAAIELLNGDEPGPAEARLRRVIKLQDDFGPAWLALGQALYRQDRPDEAVATYERVLAGAPDHQEALAPLAWALFGAQRFEDAQVVAARAVESLPDDESGWQALVIAELRLGTYPRIDARLSAARAVRDTPPLACYATQVLVEMERVADAERALMVCRDAENEGLVRNSEAAVAEARGDDAAMTAHAEDLGDDALTAYNRGIEAFNEARFDDAEALAGRAIKLRYPTPAALLLRAQTRYELGKRAAARKDLREVLGDGGSWVKVSKRGGLTGVLTKSNEVELTSRMRRGAVILVLLHIDDGDLEGAAQALAEARQAFGDYSGLKAAEAMLLRARGEEGKGWTALAEALSAEPDSRSLRIASTVIEHGAATANEDGLAAVARYGTPVMIFNLAVGSTNAGLHARCVMLVDALAAEPDASRRASEQWTEARTELLAEALSLGYDCAVRSPELEAAERFGERAGWTAVGAGAAMNHAKLLYEAGQLEALVAQVERTRAAEGEHAEWAVDLVIRAHLDREELDQALIWARHAAAGPGGRFNTGTALAVAGRSAEAKALLESACPKLEGDAAEACRTNLEIVTKALAP